MRAIAEPHKGRMRRPHWEPRAQMATGHDLELAVTAARGACCNSLCPLPKQRHREHILLCRDATTTTEGRLDQNCGKDTKQTTFRKPRRHRRGHSEHPGRVSMGGMHTPHAREAAFRADTVGTLDKRQNSHTHNAAEALDDSGEKMACTTTKHSTEHKSPPRHMN